MWFQLERMWRLVMDCHNLHRDKKLYVILVSKLESYVALLHPIWKLRSSFCYVWSSSSCSRKRGVVFLIFLQSLEANMGEGGRVAWGQLIFYFHFIADPIRRRSAVPTAESTCCSPRNKPLHSDRAKRTKCVTNCGGCQALFNPPPFLVI